MAEEAVGGNHDALYNDILATTGRARPEPRWLALLKEPPMRLHSHVAVGSPTARVLLVTLVPLLLVLATFAVALAVRPSDDTADWPTLLGDFERTGVADQGPVGRPVIRWQSQAGGAINHSVAVVGDLALVPSDDDLLHALSRSDGAERWTYPAGSSDISVVDDTAFVSDIAGSIHAVDIRTGDGVWRSEPLEGPTGAAYGDDRLYVGTQGGEIVAFDPRDGREIWRTRAADDSVNGPSFKDGRVFAGSSGLFVALDAENGSIEWTAPTANEGSGTPRLGDGIAFLSAASSAPPTTSHLRAFDIGTGEEIWNMEGQISGPVIGDGVGYSPGQGLVVAFDLGTGDERWKATFDGMVRGMGLAEGVLYVGALDERTVYALDAASGAELWRFAVDGGPTSLAVVGGVLYVGTDTGSMYAIEGDGAAVIPGPIPSVAVSAPPPDPPVASSNEVPLGAELIWEATSPDGSFLPTSLAQAPDGRIWVTDAENDRFAIFTQDGEFVEFWGESGSDEGKFDFQRDNGDWYGGLAFAPDGSFFTLDAGNRRVQHFDQDRNLVTSWGGAGAGPGQFNLPTSIAFAPDGTVHVLDEGRGVIEQYDADGTVLGAVDPFQDHPSGFNAAGSFTVDHKNGDFYVAMSQPNEVVRLDPEGTISHVYEGGLFDDAPGYPAVDAEGRLYVSQTFRPDDAPGVLVFDRDGAVLGGWGLTGPEAGALAHPTGLFVDDDGMIYVGNTVGFPESPGRIMKFRVDLEP
jgi:outer membrane protein assembly factor BamB